MIEVRNLVKRYGETLAVDDISFTLEPGKIYGFLGPNGAGKSTTMNIMTGYLGASSGDVIINGYNILDDPEKVKQYIGYLPELPPLYMEMTPEEYLQFVARLKKIPKEKQSEEIELAIERTHIDEVRNKLISNLSKGYRQRVGLAQAIMGMPEVMILDEPTVGLDPKQIIEIRDLIKSLAQEHTVILSSHVLAEVQAICDHILIIYNGKLIASGTPEELEELIGASSMEVVLKTNSSESARRILEGIEGISSVTVTRFEDGVTSLLLKLNKGADVQEAVFNACVQAGFPILTLKSTEMSLENIFLELTEAAAEDNIPVAGYNYDEGGSDE